MKKFKPILALVLVFLAGTVFGIVATRAVTRHLIRRVLAHPELVREKIERDLNRKLRLDPSQHAAVHQALTDAHQKIYELREQFQPQLVAVLSNAQKQISVVLTPEQKAKFDLYREENQKLLPFSAK